VPEAAVGPAEAPVSVSSAPLVVLGVGARGAQVVQEGPAPARGAFPKAEARSTVSAGLPPVQDVMTVPRGRGKAAEPTVGKAAQERPKRVDTRAPAAVSTRDLVAAVRVRIVTIGREVAPEVPGPTVRAHLVRAAFGVRARTVRVAVVKVATRAAVPGVPVSAGMPRPATTGPGAVRAGQARAAAAHLVRAATRVRARTVKAAPAAMDRLVTIALRATGASVPVARGRRRATTAQELGSVHRGAVSPGVRPRTVSARARSTMIRSCPMM
jgi:hypothetical protein